MALEALPAFRHWGFLPAGGGGTVSGEGSMDSFNGSVVSEGGVKFLKLSQGQEWLMSLPPGRQFVVGFMYKADNSLSHFVLQFRAGTTLDFNLRKDSNGVMTVRRGGTVLESLLPNFGDGQHRYIEVAVDLENVGYYEIRVNGSVLTAQSGVDTTVSNSDVTNTRGRVDAAFIGTSSRYAYFYWKAWEGAGDPGFYGPLEFSPLRPDGDQAAVWTPDSGVDNFSRVNEAEFDGDTSYVETSTDNDEDRYSLDSPVISSGSVIAVTPFAVSKAPVTGSPQIALGLYDGVSEYGPNRLVGTSGYKTQFGKDHTTMPGGGGITIPDLDQLELLLKAAV